MLQFEDVVYRVRNSAASSANPVKAVVSKVASQLNLEQDNYKKILKGITGSIGPGEILALMGPSGSGKTTLLKIIGARLTDNVKGSITYNDIPYNAALKRRLINFKDYFFSQTWLVIAINSMVNSVKKKQGIVLLKPAMKYTMIMKKLG